MWSKQSRAVILFLEQIKQKILNKTINQYSKTFEMQIIGINSTLDPLLTI